MNVRNLVAAGSVTIAFWAALPSMASSADAVVTEERSAQMCVDLVNQKRASIGLAPLSRWKEGERLAGEQALQDARSNDPHRAFRERIARGVHENSAQNECENSKAEAGIMIHVCIDQMWAEGPERDDGQPYGHYTNMTSSRYSKLACGFAIAPNGTMWSVQNFSVDRSVADLSGAQRQIDARAPEPREGESPGVDDFDRHCVLQTNQFRAALQLAPYVRSEEGVACATQLARAYGRGGAPSAMERACLGDGNWALSLCRSDGGSTMRQLEGCITRAGKEGPGPLTDTSHADYNDMSSMTYRQTSCGYFTDRNGTTTIVRIFK